MKSNQKFQTHLEDKCRSKRYWNMLPTEWRSEWLNKIFCTRSADFEHRPSADFQRRLPADAQQVRCGICAKYLAVGKPFKRHLVSHVRNRLDCMVCGETCNNRRHLGRHLRRSHARQTAPGVFPCVICDESFSELKSLKGHILGHSRPPKKPRDE
jgi:hypothetical protein